MVCVSVNIFFNVGIKVVVLVAVVVVVDPMLCCVSTLSIISSGENIINKK